MLNFKVLEGFNVPMHKTTQQQGPVHCINKSQQGGLNHNYNMTFLISHMYVSILHTKRECGAENKNCLACYSQCCEYLYALKANLPQWNMFKMSVCISLKAKLLILL